MQLAKLTVAQIWIISAVLSLLTILSLWYFLLKPGEDKIVQQSGVISTNKADADGLDAAKADVTKANKEVEVAKLEWSRYDKKYDPRIDTDNVWKGANQLWKQQMFELGPHIRDFITKDKTVQITSMGLQLPAPSSDPNVVSGLTMIPYELGTITVVGTFENILRHVERYNTFDRLILVHDLSLSGNSPSLTGTYAITCYIFPQGDGKGKNTPIPQAPSGGAGGGGGIGGPGMGASSMGGGRGMGAPSMGGPGMSSGGGTGAQSN